MSRPHEASPEQPHRRQKGHDTSGGSVRQHVSTVTHLRTDRAWPSGLSPVHTDAVLIARRPTRINVETQEKEKETLMDLRYTLDRKHSNILSFGGGAP